MKGCAGDVAWLSSYHKSGPSSWPTHDDGPQAVLITADEKIFIGDGLRPEHWQDSSKGLGVEGGQFVEVAFSHPSAF